MRRWIFLLAGLFMLCSTAQGQTADFTADVTSGCNPLTVQFTDLSSGATSWSWNFGNTGTSTLQNPGAIYNSPGTYTVTLTINEGAATETKTGYITVFANPQADFSVSDTSGCVPFSVTFTDSLIIPGDGAIDSTVWWFGDGSVSINPGSSPGHTYNSAGDFKVTLEVFDENGCSDQIVYDDYISTSTPPVVSFAGDVTNACDTPLTVNFSNSSTGNGNLTYIWSFGDGDSSTAVTPTHTYDSMGYYTVSLTVTDVNSCSNFLTFNDYIKIEEVIADFSPDADSVCMGTPVVFTNNSSGASTYEWDMGDGIVYNMANTNSITHIYGAPGTFEVELIASSGPGCADTVTTLIYVEQVMAGFIADTVYSCETPFEVQFTDTSFSNGTIIDWEWDFPGGSPAFFNGPNPLITYSSDTTYDVAIKVTSALGCTDSIFFNDFIEIIYPEVDFTASDSLGCYDTLEVQFTDLSTSNEPITNWDWDFDDTNTSTDQHPVHSWNDHGDYWVTLTITNAYGCTAIDSMLIEPGTHNIPDFIVGPDTCAFHQSEFMDASTDATLIDEWIWEDFGDGGSDDGPSVTHQYQDTGWMDVTYIIGYHGCYDTLIKQNAIYIDGPVIRNLAPIYTCGDIFNERWFAYDILAATDWDWDFDGGGVDISVNMGSVVSETDVIFHQYPAASGDYTVLLVAYNTVTDCEYERDVDVFIRDLEVSMDVSDTIGCAPMTVNFDASGSQDADFFYWTLGDGMDTIDAVFSYTYPLNPPYPKTYPVNLTVTDANGCQESATDTIRVFRPNPAFSAIPPSGCAPLNVNFTDTTPDTLSSWDWTFDGAVPGSSTDQHPANISYGNTGTYNVSLTVTDTLGCSASYTDNNYIRLSEPLAQFTVENNEFTPCVGETIKFLNQSNTSSGATVDDWSWDFGAGASPATATGAGPHEVSYSTPGLKTVTLTITDSYKCSETEVKTNYIDVKPLPDVGFTASRTYIPCPNSGGVMFTDTTTGSVIRYWDFGEGAGFVLGNSTAGYAYSNSGLYDVGLIVVNVFGCRDTLIKTEYITVDVVDAEFSASSNEICLGDEVIFILENDTNAGFFQWDFGDGTVLSNNSDTVIHSYNQQAGTFTPILSFAYASNANLCQDFYPGDPITVHDIKADFDIDPDSAKGCAPFTVNFYNQSVGADTWQWKFGDGNTAITEDASHTYPVAGSYDVILIASNTQTGCVDTMIRQVQVFPPVRADAGTDTVICQGVSVQLWATGGVSYLWEPAGDLSDSTSRTPIASPWQTTTYTVTVTDANGCTDVAETTIEVIERFNLAYGIDPQLLLKETTIIIGEEVQLYADAGPDVEYEWLPPFGLSCNDCPDPVVKPLDDITYTLHVQDIYGCFEETVTVFIEVIDTFRVEVPTAFSPNGDGNNDVIYVEGWGIKELLSFQVYNRWGQKVYENPGNIEDGWDGSYQNSPQNMDTYVVVVRARSYRDEVKERKQYVTLLR